MQTSCAASLERDAASCGCGYLKLFCSVFQFLPFCKGLQYSCNTEIGFPTGIGFLFMLKTMKRKPTVFRGFSDGFPRQKGYCSVKVGFPSVFRRVYFGPYSVVRKITSL